MIFAINLELKIFRTTVANAYIMYIESLKTLPILFDTCLDYMLVKFEQTRMVNNTRNFELFDRKLFFKAIFDKELTPFLKTFLELKNY